MSAISITHQFPNGAAIEVTVEVDESYPQALAEAEARCVSTYREVVLDPETIEPGGE